MIRKEPVKIKHTIQRIGYLNTHITTFRILPFMNTHNHCLSTDKVNAMQFHPYSHTYSEYIVISWVWGQAKSAECRNVIDGIAVFGNFSKSTLSDPCFVQDWEPVQHMMHDYKGMVSSWSNILGLYHNMEDKHKVIITQPILYTMSLNFRIVEKNGNTLSNKGFGHYSISNSQRP